jgi:CRISPR/Cas system CSM-associated protein Csm2 small subunit
MATIEELERRVSNLDELLRELVATSVAQTTRQTRGDAEKSAIADMLIMLATKLGIPKGRFIAEFRERINQSLDSAMRRIEDSDPSLAAMLDDRELEEIPDEDDPDKPSYCFVRPTDFRPISPLSSR